MSTKKIRPTLAECLKTCIEELKAISPGKSLRSLTIDITHETIDAVFEGDAALQAQFSIKQIMQRQSGLTVQSKREFEYWVERHWGEPIQRQDYEDKIAEELLRLLDSDFIHVDHNLINQRKKDNAAAQLRSMNVREDEITLYADRMAMLQYMKVIEGKVVNTRPSDTIDRYLNHYKDHINESGIQAFIRFITIAELCQGELAQLVPLEEQKEAGPLSPDAKIIELLLPAFKNDEDEATQFYREIQGATMPMAITDKVNELVKAEIIAKEYKNKRLWEILHNNNLYSCGLSNWNSQIK